VRWWTLKLLVLVFLRLGFSQPLELDRNHQNILKSATIYHFATYIDWPEALEAREDLNFCAMEQKSELFPLLKKGLAGKRVYNRATRAKMIGKKDQLKTCDIVYLDDYFGARLSELYDYFDPKKTVIIDGSREFLAQGGLIRFFVAKNRLRFEVNLQKARSLGYRISSEMLRHALIFKE